MSSTAALVLTVTFAVTSSAANRDCSKNMDETFKKSRAVLRAYNCRNSGSLRNCESEMGVGQNSHAMGGALGAAVAKKVRDANFGICAIAQNSWWIESAHADTMCGSREILQKHWAEKTIRELRESYSALQKKYTEQIDLIQEKLKPHPDYTKPLAEAKQAKERAWAVVQENARYWEVDMENIAENRKKLESVLTKLNTQLKGVTSEPIETITDFERFAYHAKRSEDPKQKALLKSVRQLGDELWDYDGAVFRYDRFMNKSLAVAPYKEAAKAYDGIRLEAEALAKKPVLTEKEIKALNEAAEAAKKSLDNIKKADEVASGLQTVFSPRNFSSTEQVGEGLNLLKELTAGNTRLSSEVAMAEHLSRLPNKNKAFSFGASYESGRVLERVKGLFKRGGIKQVFTGGVLVGLGVSAAHAEEVQYVLTGLDPTSSLTYSSELGGGKCQERNSLNDSDRRYLLFPIKAESGCQPDFRLKDDKHVFADRVELLNRDKEELETITKAYPEVCEFIERNYEENYPFKATGTCIEGGVSVRFKDGSRFEASGNTTRYFAESTTKEPVEITYDLLGREESLINPRAGRKGSVSKQVLDLKKMSFDARRDSLDSVYGSALPLIADAKSCCNGVGMTPTAEECARLGITESGRPDKSSTKVQ